MKAVVDCNSFYCACETLFRPEYKHKPVIVLSNNDGCIISRSEEAKALGIQMAAPFFQVRPMVSKYNIGVFSSNYNLYGDISDRVMNILKSFVGEKNVEVYSVDESFIELSHINPGELNSFCFELKQAIEQFTGIPVSIGVGLSKILCKAANRIAKTKKNETNGLVTLNTKENIHVALQNTNVSDLWGVGQRSALKLQELGIHSALDLSKMNEEWARKNLGGVVGVRLIRELRGEPCIGIKQPLQVKQNITCARMFGRPVKTLQGLQESVSLYISRAAEKLRRQLYCTCNIYVFVVTNNYENKYEYKPVTFGLEIDLPVATSQTNELLRHALPLVNKLFKNGSKYLKAGVIFSNLVPETCIQTNIFSAFARNENNILMSTIDNINYSMRNEVLKFAGSGISRDWKMVQLLRSSRYTSRWNELKEVY